MLVAALIEQLQRCDPSQDVVILTTRAHPPYVLHHPILRVSYENDTLIAIEGGRPDARS